jgi:hypothetical protein
MSIPIKYYYLQTNYELFPERSVAKEDTDNVIPRALLTRSIFIIE